MNRRKGRIKGQGWGRWGGKIKLKNGRMVKEIKLVATLYTWLSVNLSLDSSCEHGEFYGAFTGGFGASVVATLRKYNYSHNGIVPAYIVQLVLYSLCDIFVK